MPWNGQEPGGSFALGPWRVRRAGYGAMQLAGDGVFGPPRDRDEALRVLRAAAAAGVNHIDTAQYYGAGTVNELIREALHPYPDGLAIVSKVAAPDARGALLRPGEADEPRHGIEDNLVTLGATRLAAVNLRVMDPAEPPGSRFDAQLVALARAREEGLIGGVGLSNISRRHLLRAVAQTEIVCVQNLFNVADQRSRDVLTECEARGIAFVPFCPLGVPGESRRRLLTDPVLADVAARLGATPVQVALAWLLDLAPNILLIPGTRTRAHLAENLAAAGVRLDGAARADLARRSPAAQSGLPGDASGGVEEAAGGTVGADLGHPDDGLGALLDGLDAGKVVQAGCGVPGIHGIDPDARVGLGVLDREHVDRGLGRRVGDVGVEVRERVRVRQLARQRQAAADVDHDRGGGPQQQRQDRMEHPDLAEHVRLEHGTNRVGGDVGGRDEAAVVGTRLDARVVDQNV